MRRYVKQHIKMCIDCLVTKKSGSCRLSSLHLIPPGFRPFTIHMDHVGLFETSFKQNKYILVVIDYLTKYVHLFPTKSTDTEGVLNSLTEFIKTRGVPDRIISYRSIEFTPRNFENHCQSKSIKYTLNSFRHPQANGQVKRINRRYVSN